MSNKNVRVKIRILIKVEDIGEYPVTRPKKKGSAKIYIRDLLAMEMPNDELLDRMDGLADVFLKGNVVAEADPPVGITDDVSSLVHNSVQLNATVYSQNVSTAVAFQYGTTPALGSTTPATVTPVQNEDPVASTLVVAGLTPETKYYYRVRCVSATKTTYGLIKSFITEPAP